MPPPRIPARMASRIRMIKFSTTGLFDWVLKPGISFLPDYVDARPFVLHGNSLDIMFPRGLERLYENPRCRAKDLQIMEFARYEIRRQGNANLPRRVSRYLRLAPLGGHRAHRHRPCLYRERLRG